MQTEPTKIQNTYKLWQQTATIQPRVTVDRPWQVRVVLNNDLMSHRVNPIFGANPVRGRPNLTDRNLRRLTNKKTKAKVIHFASVSDMEPGDAKKYRNVSKRLRKFRAL